MNTLGRYGYNLYYLILLWGLSMLAGILSGCTIPATSSNPPTAPISKTAESAQMAAIAPATSTVEPVTPTPSPTVPVIVDATIRRSAPGENEYVIQSAGLDTFNLGDFIVVYAKDTAGFEFDAAIMYVVDRNEGNLIAKIIFQNPDITLDTLAALRVDNNLADVNLTRMAAADTAFVGFTLGEGQIRINPNEPIREGDELVAVELKDGEALPVSPLLLFHVDTVSISGEMARASIVGTAVWPSAWTLLMPQSRSNIYPPISVSDFKVANEICVRKGDQVKISAEGTIIVGEFVGALNPEGKDHFQLGGLFTTPIDPIYDIIPQFPHGVLLFRIAAPALSATEGWMHYDTTKQFEADRTGCLEFDINDKDNTDNSGEFSVQIEVNP